MPPSPTLKHFILKQQVLDLYRHVIRASRAIPDLATRKETVAWIRSDFERNKHVEDVAMIEDALKVARREIKRILPHSNDC
ncbi:complex 1 protein-domain-containing protein [Crucibulum laeve]|uniref:LYR motif-containing protein 2 n=1 Tax=Crucibulum laeve TaxID=68775 RepID=A0A5C3M6H4_9AGAR|nr:complex 1 protein-domain-containing protein [Crucibulum laeve]